MGIKEAVNVFLLWDSERDSKGEFPPWELDVWGLFFQKWVRYPILSMSYLS
jgi:hypothetical protein